MSVIKAALQRSFATSRETLRGMISLNHMKRVLIMLGVPGSGKGTQAKKMAERFGYMHISTGDLLRSLAKQQDLDADEQKALSDMRAGRLVPDWLIFKLAFAAAEGPLAAGRGIIFDGVTRTIGQARMVQEFLIGKNLLNELMVLEITLSDEQSLIRLTDRLVCTACGAIVPGGAAPASRVCEACGGELVRRADDDIDVIKKRIKEQGNAAIKPLRDFYQNLGVLVAVDGAQSIATVEDGVAKAISAS